MTTFLKKIRLTIRQKVAIGFVLSIIGLLVLGVVAYRNLLRIEKKN